MKIFVTQKYGSRTFALLDPASVSFETLGYIFPINKKKFLSVPAHINLRIKRKTHLCVRKMSYNENFRYSKVWVTK